MKNSNVFRKIISGATILTMTASILVFQLPVNKASAEVIQYVATDTSAQIYRDKPGAIICTNGVIPSSLRMDIMNGDKTFKFAPGEYLIEGGGGSLAVGSNTIFEGIEKINQPLNFKQVMVPDKTTQAVFVTRTQLDSEDQASSVIGFIQTKSFGTNMTIRNIAMQGHVVLKLDNASNTNVENVLINNYRGTYPNGQWCNMGYSATATLWLFGKSTNVNILNCNVQFSSHHGISIHSGDNLTPSTNVLFKNCRALYCGCGLNRGESPTEISIAQKAVPSYNDGRGYLDWSTGFDICENTPIKDVTLEDCYALSGWKTGFYTEPFETNQSVITNLVLRRCRSDEAGQRNVVPGSNPTKNIAREGENANFFLQRAYLEDCISVNAEKAGYLLDANQVGGNTNNDGNLPHTPNIRMVRCVDSGSPISICTEMFDCARLNVDDFVSLNAKNASLWLFGGNPADNWPGDEFVFKNIKILPKAGQAIPVIKIGMMMRQSFMESRDAFNTTQTTFKYAKYRSHITYSSLNATVYGLSQSVTPLEISSATGSDDKAAATFRTDGITDGSLPDNGITVTRRTSTLDPMVYVNDNWGKAKYLITFNSNKGSAVGTKTVYQGNKLSAPTSPKRTGFTFLGWYTTLTGGTKIVFPYTVTKSMTVYAHWKAITPATPVIKTIKKSSAKSIKLTWGAVKYAKYYQIFRSTSKSGTYKLIATTKLLSYNNSGLTTRKTYFYKLRCYNLDGKTKVYSKISAVKYVKL